MSHLAGAKECLAGFVNILRFSWISPVVDTLWSKILILSGGLIAVFWAALLSSGVVALFSRWSVSWGLNLGARSSRVSEAALRQEWGWGQPASW